MSDIDDFLNEFDPSQLGPKVQGNNDPANKPTTVQAAQFKLVPGQEPEPEQGIVGAVASDIGEGVTELIPQVAGGIADAGNELLKFADTVGRSVEDAVGVEAPYLQILDDKGDFDVKFISREERDASIAQDPSREDIIPTTDPASSTTGGLVRGVSQFVAPFAAASKGLKAYNVVTNPYLRAIVAGAFADGAATDPYQKDIIGTLNDIEAIDPYIADYIAVNDPEKVSELEARMIQAVKGAGIGITIDLLIKSVRGLRAISRGDGKASKHIEAIAEGTDNIKSTTEAAGEVKAVEPDTIVEDATENANRVIRGTESKRVGAGTQLETQLINKNAAVEGTLADSVGDAKAEELVAELELSNGASLQAGINNATHYGQLRGLPEATIPYRALRGAYDQLTPDKQKLFDEYIIAENVKADRALSLQSYKDKLVELQTDLARTDLEDIVRINKELELDKVTEALAIHESGTGRLAVGEWDDAIVEAKIAAGKADPTVTRLADAYKKVVNDFVDYDVASGKLTQAAGIARKAERPYYMPMRDDPFSEAAIKAELGEAAEGMSKAELELRINTKKLGGMTKKIITGTDQNVAGQFSDDVSRNLDIDRASVQDPIKPLDILPSYIAKRVRGNETTKAKIPILDALVEHGWARRLQGVPPKSGPDHVRVFSEGKQVVYSVPDPSIRAAFDTNPSVTIPVISSLNRAFKSGTTGPLSPFFAIKSFYFDLNAAVVGSKHSGGGFVSGGLRRFGVNTGAPETALGQVASAVMTPAKLLDDYIGTYIKGIGSVPVHIIRKYENRLGQRLLTMATENSILGKKVLGSIEPARLKSIGQFLVKDFNDSVMGQMQRNNFTFDSLFSDLSTTVSRVEEFERIRFPDLGGPGKILSAAQTGAREAWRGYKNIIDAVNASVKEAVFRDEYANLVRKYNGNVPEAEVRTLVNRVRKLSGDMQAKPAARTAQIGIELQLGFGPYTNSILQGSRFYLKELLHSQKARNTLAAVAMAKVATDQFVRSTPEGREWLEENMDSTMRNTNIFMLRPEKFMEMVDAAYNDTDYKYEFNKDDFINLGLDPFMSILVGSSNLALQGLGFIEKDASVRLGDAASTVIQPSIMPTYMTGGYNTAAWLTATDAMGAFGANVYDIQPKTLQGAAADKINSHSNISRRLYEMSGNFLGTFGRYAMESIDTFEQQYKWDSQYLSGIESFRNAAHKASDEALYKASANKPDLPMLWDAPEKMHTNSMSRDYTRRFETDTANTVAAGSLLQVKNKREFLAEMKLKGERIPHIIDPQTDPLLAIGANFMYEIQKRGVVPKLQKEYARFNNELTIVRGGKTIRSVEDRMRRENELVANMQRVNLAKKVYYEQMLEKLSNFTVETGRTYAEEFEQVYGAQFSLSNLEGAVKMRGNLPQN